MDMADREKFIQELNAKYSPKGEFITLGKGMLNGEVVRGCSLEPGSY